MAKKRSFIRPGKGTGGQKIIGARTGRRPFNQIVARRIFRTIDLDKAASKRSASLKDFKKFAVDFAEFKESGKVLKRFDKKAGKAIGAIKFTSMEGGTISAENLKRAGVPSSATAKEVLRGTERTFRSRVRAKFSQMMMSSAEALKKTAAGRQALKSAAAKFGLSSGFTIVPAGTIQALREEAQRKGQLRGGRPGA